MANRFLTLVAGIPRLLKRVIFPNDGLRIEDDDASHLLTLLAAAMSANGSLTLDVANGTRRLVINGNTTLNGTNSGDLTLGVPASAVFSITGQELSVVDAGADKIPFWDESAGNMAYATIGSGLTMTGATLSATGGNASGNASDGDTLAIGFEFPRDGLKVADVSGNHTLTLGVSGNLTGNRTVSYLDPGGNVSIDLSAHAGLTYRPPVTLAIDGNVTSSSTTLTDVTGFACEIAANETMIIELLGWTATNLTTTGVGFAVTGPSSPVSVLVSGSQVTSVSGLRSEIGVTSFATGFVFATGPSPNPYPVSVLIKICNGANAGTIQVQIKSETGGSVTWHHPMMRITRPEIV